MGNKRISIVMTYFNRPNQLFMTLKSISRQYDSGIEIIIVDDGSDLDKKASGVTEKFPMDIKVVNIDRGQKTWINPCVPYNRGFRESTGNIVIIQNPECVHIGNVIQRAETRIKGDNYLSFSCYSADKAEYESIIRLAAVPNEVLDDRILNLITYRSNAASRPGGGEPWFNHPTVRPVNYHFCSVITRKNLFELGGFDERYAMGYCWDDNSFLHRVKLKGLRVTTLPIDYGFVVHLWHPKGPLCGACPEWHKNRELFETMTKKLKDYNVGCL